MKASMLSLVILTLEFGTSIASFNSFLPFDILENFQDDIGLLRRGYDRSIRAECEVQLFGTPPDTACGQRDLKKLQRVFSNRFNKFQDVFAEKSLNVDFPPLMAYELQTPIQYLDSGTSVSRALRKNDEDQNRNLVFNFFYNILGFRAWMICRTGTCNPDDGDGRRHLELAIRGVAERVKRGLINSERSYFENIKCVRIICKGGDAPEESEGCDPYPQVSIPDK